MVIYDRFFSGTGNRSEHVENDFVYGCWSGNYNGSQKNSDCQKAV